MIGATTIILKFIYVGKCQFQIKQAVLVFPQHHAELTV